MAYLNKTVTDVQVQEDEVARVLLAWYKVPGIQRDLRHKENQAVQTVLEVLERRRATAKKAAV